MKLKRTLRKAAGVLLILMLTSGAQAAPVALIETNFSHSSEMRIFPFEIMEGGLFKAALTDFEFPAPFDHLALANLKEKEMFGAPLSGPEIFKFQAAPGIFTANVPETAEGDSILSLFRLKTSDEPIPTAALLVLVGLIALIALKGRRK